MTEPRDTEQDPGEAVAGCRGNAALQARGDARGDLRIVGHRAAQEHPDVRHREGQPLGTFREDGPVRPLGRASEHGSEGLGADDRAHGADQERSIGREVAFLGDHLVRDPLGRIAGDAWVGQRRRGP